MININIDNIDKYYEIINNKIDDYFKYNIDPLSLKRYLKKGSIGMNKFIEKSELIDIKNIEKIITDVVDDRIAKKELEIITFENFIPNDFIIKFDISEQSYKTIADIYKVSLGHLIIDKNNIKLSGLKSDKEIYVYNRTHLDVMYDQVCDKIYNQLRKDIMVFDLLDINIKLYDKIEKKYFKEKVFESIKEDYNIIEKIISLKTNHNFTVMTPLNNDLIIFEKNLDR